MARFKTLMDQQLSTDFIEQTNNCRVSGKLADVYRELANSEAATLAYLQMEQALQAGPLTNQQLEAIKLVVSEYNQCDFCLSTHHVKSQHLGLSVEAIMALRAGNPCGDQMLDALAVFVRRVLESGGKVDDTDIERIQSQGLNDQALVDILLAISAISFTNFFNGVNQTKLMFKPAPEVERE